MPILGSRTFKTYIRSFFFPFPKLRQILFRIFSGDLKSFL